MKLIKNNKARIVENESTQGEEVGCAESQCPPAHPRLPLEPVKDELTVAGVPVSPSCKYTLPTAGCLLISIGTLLSVYGYGHPTPEDTIKISSQRANSRVLGPVLLSLGLIALLGGSLIYWLAHWARKKEERVCFHCPIHGDFFPVTTVPLSAVKGEQDNRILCVGVGSSPPTGPPEAPPCPYSQLLTARSSVCSDGSCPTPKPFVIDHSLRCAEYFWPLNASQDIASFPASRTPSPVPINQVTDVASHSSAPMMMCSTLPDIRVVAPLSNNSSSTNDCDDSSSITVCGPSLPSR